MKEYSKLLAARLESLINLVLGELNVCDRTKIITLITVDVHNRDVVQALIDNKIRDAGSFKWQSQLRYVYDAAVKECGLRIADASFDYVRTATNCTHVTPFRDAPYTQCNCTHVTPFRVAS
jgi:dynein heavy chain